MKQNQRQLSRVGQQKIEQLRNLEIKFVGVSGWVKHREEESAKNRRKKRDREEEKEEDPTGRTGYQQRSD